MAKPSGLIQRGRTYSIHKRIPTDVAHHYPKTTISEALGTRDYEEAKRRYFRRAAELEEEWAELRSWSTQKLAAARSLVSKVGISPERCETMSVAEIKAIAGEDPGLPHTDEGLDEIQAIGWEKDVAREHARLRLRVFIATGEDRYLDWYRGQEAAARSYGSHAPVPLPDGPAVQALTDGHRSTAPAPAVKSARTLSTALQVWRDTRNPRDQTFNDYHAKIRRFEELHGRLSVQSISREHIASFIDALRLVPMHLNNSERTKPLPELVKSYESDDRERMSQPTVRKHVECVRTMLKFVAKLGWIEANPADGITIPKSIARSRRAPFNLGQRKAALSYVASYDDHRYWLPALALYTGARLDELGQLHTSDVLSSGEIHYIRITDEDGKQVKNAGSIRDVPLHRDIVAAGFLHYVDHLPAGPLFPGLKPDTKGKITGLYSKEFGRDLRHPKRIGITDPAVVFHSFRHTFKDLCRNAGIEKDVHDRLTGHVDRSVSSSYGSGHSLETLNDALQRLNTEVQLTAKSYPARQEAAAA